MATRFTPQSGREAGVAPLPDPPRSLRKWRSVLGPVSAPEGQDGGMTPGAIDRRFRVTRAPAVRGCAVAPRRGGALRDLADRIVASASLVSTGPVLDTRDFAWTARLRDAWRAIRDEVAAADGDLARCPGTRALIAAVPDVHAARVCTLPPGTHLPARRGPTMGLLTCHLGLVVPRTGDARMRVADRVVRWAEGETLVFDDSRDHEVWNETDAARTVLTLQVRRPLRWPGRWVSSAMLAMGDGAGADRRFRP